MKSMQTMKSKVVARSVVALLVESMCISCRWACQCEAWRFQSIPASYNSPSFTQVNKGNVLADVEPFMYCVHAWLERFACQRFLSYRWG